MFTIIYTALILNLGFYFWGIHEASFKRHRSALRKSNFSLFEKYDPKTKRYMNIMQGVFCLLAVIHLSVIYENWMFAITVLIYCITSKKLVGECSYGYYATGNIIHVGVGGPLDDELSKNEYVNFSIRLTIFIISNFILFFTNKLLIVWF